MTEGCMEGLRRGRGEEKCTPSPTSPAKNASSSPVETVDNSELQKLVDLALKPARKRKGTRRAGRDASVDRCEVCGSWRLNRICQPCTRREEAS